MSQYRQSVFAAILPNRLLQPIKQHGVAGATRKALTSPTAAYRHLSAAETPELLPRHRYESPPSPNELESFVLDLGLDATHRDITDAWLALAGDEQFRAELTASFRRTATGPDVFYHNWRDVLSVLVRLTEPEMVVETGVRGGLSAAYLLSALDRNARGSLVSIDLGDTSVLPADLDDPEIGWLVPHRLREHWELRLGDSTTELPSVLDDSTDLFFSDVPNAILRDELAIAATRMRPGSIIVTCCPVGSAAEATWNEFADAALTNTSRATRWVSEDGRSDLCAGILGDHGTGGFEA
ncbi:class I SAM-dependent methyltransferase [Haloferax larsenii]|uniref:Class I SAM-dependent methyltransferase n=1 Tax=Haloferax larsenii TaxID=302484 RepID=A0ABY5RHN0_HALLR|nr:class I SAM-dependent methyltransferase [Haloferax larsenii]UVE51418.1 class I SAM-dependent methyltransferase [Haloferax larsenii]